MTRRLSAILRKDSDAGQAFTPHFSVPSLEYQKSTSYKNYRPEFGILYHGSYGKRPISYFSGEIYAEPSKVSF